MSVVKPTTNPAAMKISKLKGQADADPSTKTINPAANTRRDVVCTQESGRITMPKRTRKKTTVPMVDI